MLPLIKKCAKAQVQIGVSSGVAYSGLSGSRMPRWTFFGHTLQQVLPISLDPKP